MEVVTDKERSDIEKRDYVVLQKPQGQDNHLPPPRTLIMYFTMTHVRFGCSHVHPIGQLTHTRRSDGAFDPDGDLKEVSDRLYDDSIRLIFLDDHRRFTVSHLI